MKIISLAALLLAAQLLAFPLRAGDIKEADYPVQYEVISTQRPGDGLGKHCTMTVRDKSQTKIALNISRKGFGSCRPPDAGNVYRGRENQKKNELELVIQISQDKARIEEWQIIGIITNDVK